MDENYPKDTKDTDQEQMPDLDVPRQGDEQPNDADQISAQNENIDVPSPEIETQNKVIVGNVRNKKRTIISVAILVGLCIIAAVILVLVNNSQKSKPALKQTTTAAPVKAAAIVSVTSTSFSPATVEIKKGQSVTWKNTDTANHQPSADPFPTNTGLPDLGKGEILKQNDEFTYQFEKSGTYTYHDNLNPYKIKGVVIVKD